MRSSRDIFEVQADTRAKLKELEHAAELEAAEESMRDLTRRWMWVARSGVLLASSSIKTRLRRVATAVQNLKSNFWTTKRSQDHFISWLQQDHSEADFEAPSCPPALAPCGLTMVPNGRRCRGRTRM